MVRIFKVLRLEFTIGVYPTLIPYVGVEVMVVDKGGFWFSIGFWRREFFIQVTRGE